MDIFGIILLIIKYNYLVMLVEEFVYCMCEVFYIVCIGWLGLVFVDILKDVQNVVIIYQCDDFEIVFFGYCNEFFVLECQVVEVFELICWVECLIIFVGYGVQMSGVMEELQVFVEKVCIFVVFILFGKGGLFELYFFCFGMMGMYGGVEVNCVIQKVDLLFVFGMCFDDCVIGNFKIYVCNVCKIYVDIDLFEINKNVIVDVGIVGDFKLVFGQMLLLVECIEDLSWFVLIGEWCEDSECCDIIGLYGEVCGVMFVDLDKLFVVQVIYDLCEFIGGNVVIVIDVGQYQMFEVQYYLYQDLYLLIILGGFGMMGFGLFVVIGVKMGCFEKNVWVIVGDGGFQMMMMELVMVVQEGVNVNIVVINNGYFGMVCQWQEFFYEECYYVMLMVNLDFCKIVEVYGIFNCLVIYCDQILEVIVFVDVIECGLVFIEFVVEQEEIVYLMVFVGVDFDVMLCCLVLGEDLEIVMLKFFNIEGGV